MKKPTAILSLDLDNQWSYMKTHGDAGWEAFPSYLSRVVPRILQVLEELGLRITFFIVGKDAEMPENAEALRSIAEAGHEIANHSFWHEPWFHQYGYEETEAEVAAAERAIESATGVKPRGWRSPGFSLTPTLLNVLENRGYEYDGSTFPTYLGPIARLFFLASSGLRGEEREKRAGLYGNWKDGFRPLKPFSWTLPKNRSILEIPVTTCPVLRVPMHASYLLYLATFSRQAESLYFKTALSLCRARRIAPSFLLHPTDFLGCEDVPEMGYFPAMNKPSAWKQREIRKILEVLSSSFGILPMGEYARVAKEKCHKAIRTESSGRRDPISAPAKAQFEPSYPRT